MVKKTQPKKAIKRTLKDRAFNVIVAGELWRCDNPLTQRIIGRRKAEPCLLDDPRKLMLACKAYFEWCDMHLLTELKVGWYEGRAYTHDIDKMRAYSIPGICAFIGVTRAEWKRARTRKPPMGARVQMQRDFEDCAKVVDWAENIIFEQNYSGAAAGLLESGIVSKVMLASMVETGDVIEHEANENLTDDSERFTRAITSLVERSRPREMDGPIIDG